MPLFKIGLQILVTLPNDLHNSVVYIWQNLSVFMPKKCNLKVLIVPYDKWASSRENLSSGFPKNRDSNQSNQL